MKTRIIKSTFTDRQKYYEQLRARVMEFAKRGLSIKEIAYESKIRSEFIGQTLRFHNWESMHLSPEERKAVIKMRSLLKN
jgi:hypothetical protein